MAQTIPAPTPTGAAEARRLRIGVLALQGDVREHAKALREVGADPIEVRLPRDLVGIDGLILPGGESTTIRRLIDLYGLQIGRAQRLNSSHPQLSRMPSSA